MDDTKKAASKIAKGLTKPEVQRLRRAEAMLKSYQDEKLDIYQKQVHEMSEVFERAREVREWQKAEYEERRQRVIHQLSDMRVETDSQAKTQHARLKSFSSDFEAGVAKCKVEWRELFYTNQADLGRRNSALDTTLTGLAAALETERQECRSHAESQTAAILEKLRQHREELDKETSERREKNEKHSSALEEDFDALGSKLATEAAAREKQCADMRAAAADRFVDLVEQQDTKDAKARAGLGDLGEQLKAEADERQSAQATVSSRMMQFMEELEKNILENQRKQGESSQKLQQLKAAMYA